MSGWNLLYPAFLAGAVAIAVPIVLHLLGGRAAPTVLFSATRFLSHAPVETARRRRLREMLLLALRVGALLLLVLAFARPYTDRGVVAATATATVIAIDTSASMGGAARFEGAMRRALEIVDAAPADQLVGVVTFADEVTEAAAPTIDRERVREAIRNARAGYGATAYGRAIAGSVTALGDHPGRIVVITDLQRGGWEAPGTPRVPPGTRVEVVDIGPVPANLAVTDLRATDGRLTATVTGHGRTASRAAMTLAIDGATVERTSADVTLDGSADVTFAHVLPAAGEVRVAIDDVEGLPADNERFLLLDRPDAPRVIVIGASGSRSAPAFFVHQALRARNEARALDVRVDGAPAGRTGGDPWTRPDVVVFVAGDSTGDAARGLGAHVARGGGVLLVAGPALDLGAFEDIAGVSTAGGAVPVRRDPAATLSPADTRHPVFRSLGAMMPALGHVRVERHVALSPRGDAIVLARFSDGDPALVEFGTGTGKVLTFASDMGGAWNDLPVQPVFVPFLHQLVGYLAPAAGHPSSYLVTQVPAGLEARPGVVTEPTTDRRIAVNVDPRESVLTRLTPDEFTASIASNGPRLAGAIETGAGQREAGQQYWWYAVLLMLVLVVAEGFVGQRGT